MKKLLAILVTGLMLATAAQASEDESKVMKMGIDGLAPAIIGGIVTGGAGFILGGIFGLGLVAIDMSTDTTQVDKISKEFL